MVAASVARISTYDAEDWRDHAACADEATAQFFPLGTSPSAQQITAQAKAVCATCPVRRRCLEFAITTNQEYGVWGGADEDERRAIRRQWRRTQRIA